MYKFTDKYPLEKENIFKVTNTYTIFRHYIGEFKIGKAIKSPIRKDSNPSFTININRATNEFFYHDKRYGGGDAISFVRELFRLSYAETLLKIVKDLGLTESFELTEAQLKGASPKRVEFKVDYEKLKEEAEVEIKVKTRKWTLADKSFWTKFGIKKSTLIKYNVAPVSHIFLKNNIVKAETLAYVFREFKDFKETLTIYQPFSLDFKWIKTHDSSVWYGWDQLPDTGDRLIITKSLKDIMCIVDVMGTPSTGLQNEKVLPKLGIILDLRGRFKNIYYLGDNDFDKEINWGRESAKKLEKEFGFNLIEIPTEYKCKDFSDLIVKYGQEKAKEIINKEISNVIYF